MDLTVVDSFSTSILAPGGGGDDGDGDGDGGGLAPGGPPLFC